MTRRTRPRPQDAADVERALQNLLDAIAGREHLAPGESIILDGNIPFTRECLDRLAKQTPAQLRATGLEAVRIAREIKRNDRR